LGTSGGTISHRVRDCFLPFLAPPPPPHNQLHPPRYGPTEVSEPKKQRRDWRGAACPRLTSQRLFRPLPWSSATNCTAFYGTTQRAACPTCAQPTSSSRITHPYSNFLFFDPWGTPPEVPPVFLSNPNPIDLPYGWVPRLHARALDQWGPRRTIASRPQNPRSGVVWPRWHYLTGLLLQGTFLAH
jgi:hypothetical protein